MRRISRRSDQEERDARFGAFIDGLIEGAMTGEITAAALEQRLLVDARRLGRLLVDGTNTGEDYEFACLDLDFAAKLLVLADDREASLSRPEAETSPPDC